MKFNWAWILIPCIVLLTGCEERYRYPCQNPENWDNKICKKPYCSANGTCPEDLKHYEKENSNGTQSSALTNKCPQLTNAGVCK